MSSTLTFFAKTYASEFGFTRGPPVHDMLAIAYIIDPTLFYRRVPSPGDAPNLAMYDADPHSNKDAHMPKSGSSRGINSLGLDNVGDARDSSDAAVAVGTPPKRYRVDVECSDGLAAVLQSSTSGAIAWSTTAGAKAVGTSKCSRTSTACACGTSSLRVVERAEAHLASSAPARRLHMWMGTAWMPSPAQPPLQDRRPRPFIPCVETRIQPHTAYLDEAT